LSSVRVQLRYKILRNDPEFKNPEHFSNEVEIPFNLIYEN